MRSQASQFWGQVVPQNLQLQTGNVTAMYALASVLPLAAKAEDVVQDLGTDAATVQATVSTSTQQPPTLPSQAQQPPSTKTTSEIFTLNELSRAKKRKADEDDEPSILVPEMTPSSTFPLAESSPAGTDTPPENPEYESKRQAKKQRQAAKKARKDAEKLEAEAEAQATQPFDYAGAESFLSASAQASAAVQGAKRMNPFAKALDTSTGARRGKMGKELAGKSMTFTS
jgi:hypothetical protein